MRKKLPQSSSGRSKSIRGRSSKSPKRRDATDRDANRRLQSILVANEIAAWTWDVANNRVFADENLARILGITANTPLAAPSRSTFKPSIPTIALASPPPSIKRSKARPTDTKSTIASSEKMAPSLGSVPVAPSNARAMEKSRNSLVSSSTFPIANPPSTWPTNYATASISSVTFSISLSLPSQTSPTSSTATAASFL